MHTQDVGPHRDVASRSTTLHGRGDELERIDDLLRGARASQQRRPRAARPRGHRQVRAARRGARAGGRHAGPRLPRHRGRDRLPFAALHQLLRPVLDRVEAIPAIQARALRCALGLEFGARPEPLPRRRWRCSTCSRRRPSARPLLCVVDDAHWLDDATADILALRRAAPDAEPIAMLFAAREEHDARLEAPGLAAAGARRARRRRGARDHRARERPRARARRRRVARRRDRGQPARPPRAVARRSPTRRPPGVEPILGPLPISSHARARVPRARAAAAARHPAAAARRGHRRQR